MPPPYNSPPKYPVIDASPSLATIVGNFNSSEWNTVLLSVLASLPVGYLSARGALRLPSTYFAGGVGLFGGFLLAFQQSAGRLVGYLPNDAEVAKFKPPLHDNLFTLPSPLNSFQESG
eukprot:CAMPEP_0184348366 /NCGR_PEP_ID=MMETSP1089-20130417/27596_1 /TAXON_ID=38269 ORGANISM="Gloeochaete wittrockiana, Strain SAG46.84" /NCGR_SAMPLE_ID=MMETSP1089 /ASSEMBLY_ACC=CAM_ASM_000445 /LENGTH=117 /DNA_ID=CAMNT_0026680035 /DNA_START=88 /DNA_END=442 /DNA_ORIENTATION=+